MELVHGAHPLRVASCQIIVDGHDVYALAGQCIEEYRQCGHQCLALARRHLGYASLMQDYAAEELHVVVHHVPFDVVAARLPVVAVYGLVSVDRNEVLSRGKVAVEVGRRDLDRLVFGESARRILHYGESLRQQLFELLLDLLVDALCCRVDVFRYALFLVERRIGQFETRLLLDDMTLVVGDECRYLTAQIRAAFAQGVVAQRLDGGVYGLDLLDVGLYLLAVLLGLRPEEQFYYTGNYIHL